MNKKNLFVIDVYNLIYRMFYAIPEMHTRDGMHVNAIFGVAKFLKNIAEENPDACIVAASDSGKTFRSEIFGEYKGTRERMPDNLRSQIEGVFDLFSSSGIQVLQQEGYEADDLMGSIAIQYSGDEYQVIIISSDKDLCQFVRDDYVHIYDAMKRKFMRRNDVIEKFGVPPEQVCDYLAIVGDSADNIPGIAGFGPKKTADLLQKFSSLEGIYDNLDSCTPKMRSLLESSRDLAFLSKQLATIVTDLKISIEGEKTISQQLSSETYLQELKKLEFKSLLPKDFLEEKPKESISVTEITTDDQYRQLYNSIDQNMIGFELDNNSHCYISLGSQVYKINPRKVYIQDLIDDIISGRIIVATFDLKAIFFQLRNVYAVTPSSKNQDSLF